MELIQNVPQISAYLAADEVVDHGHPLVRETAADLKVDTLDAYSYAKAAFEFVRDAIPHSCDTGDMRVPWRASDVLAQRTGICCAKSHALVALLRAGSIPAALCYQRLNVVHGLVALKLPGRERWARVDPRGNKAGIDAQFSLERERLAYEVEPESNEMNYPVLYDVPHPAVLDALRAASDQDTLWTLYPAEL
ncbi:transglutaminase family protein [Streptomyces sp. NBC_00322]|uniref:transglutaminase-like domain-containing protein n=1 Tax=Streptomyces sp. NBC_00322 TaxID=2975712 RepID=UPI002E294C28|nr:transglutaminase family protein [Streptomyces sp. NBC_00322]